MKTTEQKEKSSQIKVEILNTAKRVLWNRRRHYSYLTQYKFSH